MFHRKKTSIIGTGTAFDNSLFWLTIIILVFSTGGLTWQYIPTFNLETHVTEYDKIIIESFSIIYYSIISLISLRILVKIIKKKEVSWTTSHSNKALSLFFLFILLNIIWNININLFQWMTNYVNTDFELGRIYNLTALLLHIAISYTLLSFFSLFLIALATSIYKIQSFLNTKQHSKTNVPVHSSDECSSLANLKFRLESQVSIQHLKQLFIIVAICSSLLIGVWFFSNFAGNSVMSEINAAARSVNTERIAKVIEQDGLDTKIASIKTKIMKARLANLNPHKIETLERKKITTSSEQTITVWQPKSNQSINQNTASEIINELEKIDTLSISGEKINYPLLLKKNCNGGKCTQ
ncbi:hypothetical protein [Halodesulfovibrio sp. MK-HDV]|uniref:hypothetical protein n=1 Tax=Halodesulfovibrio sp. MK-HDV TaxID=2599925 RepID=UPI00136D4F1B|nr:hypothetical protein [Halodesulfovibrio sp. MK-HDV]KAF1077649.1 hypothetical protein MKHDV_00105 [Halodesulfovibrio sp. MK-HDV]